MHRRHHQFSPLQVSIGVIFILVLLVSFIQMRNIQKLHSASAAGESIKSFEAEQVTRTGPVSIGVNDTLASNNSYILFGTSLTPTITTPPTISPTLILTASPTPTVTGNAQYPAQVLNLTNWKITIPYDGTDSGTDADEVKQPVLATYTHPEYFFVSPAKNSVIFRAHAGGATTSGSGYPRSELRERTNNGTADASWTSSGNHTMTVDMKVNNLPTVQPKLVIGQIHGGSDDLVVFLVEGSSLYVRIGDTDKRLITNNFPLKTRFTIKFEVASNVTKFYYNGALQPFTMNKSFSTAYFKTGAYTQSSCQGEKKVPGELCSAYGEVEIFNVQVTHN